MNLTIAKALVLDAFYQVVDNMVFRLMVLLTGIPILISFLVGFTEEGISFLFGLKVITYADFAEGFGQALPEGSEEQVQEKFIQGFQGIIVEGLSGTIGVIFCIAATAFFIPRMLEKGTADTVFSKPVARLALLVARYLSGVIFVFLISSVLVIGVHLGLTVVSGYSDPGFLWGVLTLTYVFALIHSFSTVIAVFTRSSVAAILTSLIFFSFNGCVHDSWRQVEMYREQQRLEQENRGELEVAEPQSEGREVLGVLTRGIAVLHYAFPKTGDAGVLTRKLRRSLEGDEFHLKDEVGGLVVESRPFGSVADVTLSREHEDSELRFVATWRVEDAGREVARVRLDRLDKDLEPSPDGEEPGAVREQRLTTSNLSKTATLEIEARPRLVTPPTRTRSRVANQYARFLRWSEDTDNGRREFERIFFGFSGYIYQLESRWDPAWRANEDRDQDMQAFLAGLSFPDLEALSSRPDEWYERKFRLDAPLRFNILFSIGSSLAFLAAMLGLAWLRLSRIDF